MLHNERETGRRPSAFRRTAGPVLFILFTLLFCLVLAGQSLADENAELSPTNRPEGSQLVYRPDGNWVIVQEGVQVISERGGVNGIRHANADHTKFTLNSINEGTPDLTAGRKVVIIDEEAVASGEIGPHLTMGTVKSHSGNTLTINPLGENVTTQEEQVEEFYSYVVGYADDHDWQKTYNVDNSFEPIAGYKVYVQGSITYHIKVHGWAPKWWYERYEITYHVDIDLKELRLDLAHTTAVKVTIPLFTIDVAPLIGIPISAFVKCNGTGQVGFSYQKSYGGYVKFDLTIPVDPVYRKEEPAGPGFQNASEVGFDATIGLQAGIAIEFLHVFELGIAYGGGVKISGTLFTSHWFPEDLREKKQWHACEKCFQLTMTPIIGPLSIDIDIVHLFSDGFDLIPEQELSEPFYEYHKSYTFDGWEGDGLCPLRGNRLVVTVKDGHGNPIKGVKLSYTPFDDKYKGGDGISEATTDASGQGKLYIPTKAGITQGDTGSNTVGVLAELEHGHDTYRTSKNAEIKGLDEKTGRLDPETLEITLDCIRSIYFKSDIPAKLPPTMNYFQSDEGGVVNLPDTVPVVTGTGYTFTGWNDRPDGSGKSYAPGGTVRAGSTDLTLYAQWKEGPIQGVYTVVYNPNGGSSAPAAGVAKMGETFTLSAEKAAWDTHVFKGWAFDDEAFEADFQPGDTLTDEQLNPGKDRTVTLYAVWGFDPVDMPVRLQYDMNGGPEDQRPSDQWVKPNSTLMVSSRTPVWDQMHLFAGWSTDRDAAEGDFYPGESIYMTEDTKLYAIWRYKTAPPPNRIEFRDIGSGNAQGMPDTIFFIYEEGVHINLPDNVPEKPGLYFIGWNTEEDGGGTTYMPGSAVRPTGDMVLYAQWHILNNQYSILYNPNGGTSAPSPQFADLDGETVLTDEQAVWAQHKFLGWARDDEADEPEFPAGKTNKLSNPDRLPTVTLYAVWGFDPVMPPVRLAYDMNGGPAEQKPSDQWVTEGSWIQISSETPVWDELHLFNGWSTEPEAAWGEYEPGQAIRLDEDMTLYAVWVYTPVAVPVTVTYDLNGGLSNKPEDQETWKDLAFELSETKPAWDGQHKFRGWSENPADGEAAYQPGETVRFQRDTTLYAVWKTKYKITEGDGSTWEGDRKKGLRFVADGNADYFHHLQIDGKAVSNSQYDVSSGSTVVDLKPEFLKQLEEGKHTIRFAYFDGNADGTFTVKNKIPKTGDAARPWLWAGMILAGTALLAAAGTRRRARGGKK